jgi:hypothetical protein
VQKWCYCCTNLNKIKRFDEFVTTPYTTNEYSVDCDTPDVDVTEGNSPWPNIMVMRQVRSSAARGGAVSQ